LFKPKQTGLDALSATKTLCYAHHGAGKTTQAALYQEAFGKGFLISGEGGLASIANAQIDYLPFSSWDGEHDEDKDVYSFRGICRMVGSKEFAEAGYKWIGIDSLTEVSDQLDAALDKKYTDPKATFRRWGEYSRSLIGSLKWLRDLPFHVYVSCLAKDEEDDNGRVHYWPMVASNKAAKKIPGIFDNVFALVRETEQSDDKVIVTRNIICDEVHGWHGKVRDPHRRIPPIINTASIPDVLKTLHMSDQEFSDWLSTLSNGENNV